MRRKKRRGNVGKSSRYFVIPVSSDQNAILTPLQREKRWEECERRKKEREGEEVVAGSSGRFSDKSTVGDGFYQSGPSWNPSRAFPCLRVC